MEEGGAKTCSRCGTIKPATLEFFEREPRNRDGWRGVCKSCRQSDGRRYYGQHAEQRREAARKYRAANPEKVQASLRQSYQRYREARLEGNHRYYVEHREELKAAEKARRASDPEGYRQRLRVIRVALKAEMQAAYGGKCACCGETETAFLTLEHVNRDGAIHRKLMGGQGRIYYALKRAGWPKDGFTLLCWNCQMATSRGAICPHQVKSA